MKPANFARLTLLSLIWGASFLFIKVAVEGMHPTLVALARTAIGAGAVLVWVRISGVSLPRSAGDWTKLAFMAVFANMIPFTLISVAEKSITSALASVLNATTPLMTALVASTVIRTESISPMRALGVIVGFAGVATIVLPGAGLEGAALAGSLMVVGSTLSYGFAGAFAKRHLRGDAVSHAAGQLVLASGGMALVAAVAAPGAPFALTVPRAAAVATLGALGTGIAWVVYLRIIAEEGPTTASMVTYLVPFVSVIIGRIVLGETLRWNAYLGGAIVIAGIAIAERRGEREPPTVLAPAESAERT